MHQFTVGNVTFTAVRMLRPIPHWLARIDETGRVLESGIFNGESRPKLKADIEYLFSRVRGDCREFRRVPGIR